MYLCWYTVMGLLFSSPIPSLSFKAVSDPHMGRRNVLQMVRKWDFSKTNLKDFLDFFSMQRNACLHVLPEVTTVLQLLQRENNPSKTQLYQQLHLGCSLLFPVGLKEMVKECRWKHQDVVSGRAAISLPD